MKSPKTPHAPHHRAAVVAASFAAIVSLAVSAVAAPAVKDHILFVGTDLDVKEGSAFYHVVGATKDSLKIEKDHQLADVRIGQGANIRVNKGVKLSTLSATISNVATESVDRASARAQLEAMQTSLMLQETASSDVDLAYGQVAIYSGAGVNADLAPESYKNLQAYKQGADDRYSAALNRMDPVSGGSNTYLIDRLEGHEQTEVQLSFDVASPEPLDHAYIVVVANYGSGDKIARQISARQFDRIGSRPQHVTMSHAAAVGGLPFAKFDVALFADGQEVATNLSEKQMPLTTDEAYQFFLIDYLSSHQKATLPPAPMLMTPRPEFRRAVQDADVNRPVYATIAKTGNVVTISADAAGKEDLPAAMKSALQNVRFMPALKDGSPVDGHLKVTLAEIVR
jgi:hypothetical protein